MSRQLAAPAAKLSALMKKQASTKSGLVRRLIYTGDVVAFKMGRRQGGPSRTSGRRAHI
jgi:hypothetical protein